jgi:hypothetical protein
MQNIVLFGRRWTDCYGNVHHTVEIIVDGAYVCTAGPAVGFGRHYIDTAFRRLAEMGLVRLDGEEPLAWARDRGIRLYYTACDVARKRDL